MLDGRETHDSLGSVDPRALTDSSPSASRAPLAASGGASFFPPCIDLRGPSCRWCRVAVIVPHACLHHSGPVADRAGGCMRFRGIPRTCAEEVERRIIRSDAQGRAGS